MLCACREREELEPGVRGAGGVFGSVLACRVAKNLQGEGNGSQNPQTAPKLESSRENFGKRQLRGSPQGWPRGTQGAPCSPWSSDAFCRPKSFWGRQRGCDCRAVSASCPPSHRGGAAALPVPPLLGDVSFWRWRGRVAPCLGTSAPRMDFWGCPVLAPKGSKRGASVRGSRSPPRRAAS